MISLYDNAALKVKLENTPKAKSIDGVGEYLRIL